MQIELSDNIAGDVFVVAMETSDKWDDQTIEYWRSRLQEEIDELDAGLAAGDIMNVHHELTQIASIAMNYRRWLTRHYPFGGKTYGFIEKTENEKS